MKPDIPTNRTSHDWSPVARSFLIPVAMALSLGLSAFLFIAATRTRSPKVEAAPPKVLMIGDSLSVGKFGEVLHDYLANTYGNRNVWVYASCGSSPENWLRSEPVFATPCGYRSETPTGLTYIDYVNGHKPRRVDTPKVERLISENKPTIVIVQLGTNWMDKLISGNPQKEAEINAFAQRFVSAIHPDATRRLTWIMPPDHSRYSRRIQDKVDAIIRAAVRGNRYVDLIPSRDMTHYVPGKTGGDGVHYNSESSIAWANRVINRLKQKSTFAGLY